MGKIIETKELGDRYSILTDDGWKPITLVHKTIPYKIWKIKTKDFFLECADEHIVINEKREQIFVSDLNMGDKVITKNGIQEILSIDMLDKKVNMYDVTVDSKEHTFFSNGILSHNTTIASLYLLWVAIFNLDQKIAVLGNKEQTAIEILSRVKLAYERLPLWLQPGLKDGGWSKKKIELGNGVSIMSASTGSSAIRGFSLNILYCDEFAFVPENISDEFICSTFPTLSGKNSKMIISSTPAGLNNFYHIYKNAVDGKNNFVPVNINWWEVPGRDDEFKEKIIKDIGLVKWNQEYAAQFLGSSKTLVSSDILERLAGQTVDPIALSQGDCLWIYERPIDNAFYILGVDSAKGTYSDYSVVQVLKIKSEFDIEQVAKYRFNGISPQDFSQVCIGISDYYNQAYMMVENNDVGGQVADAIWYQYDCDRILNCDKKGLGIRATRKSKLEANMLLKKYMEEGWLKIRDKDTIYELTLYEEVSPDVFNAGRTNHDDCFKEDALVKTIEGYKPIKDIKIGDKVLTHKGRWRKVTSLIEKDFDGDWYDMKFRNQLNLSCSYNHPIYTSNREWKFPDEWDGEGCINVKMPLGENKNKILKFDDWCVQLKNGINVKKDDKILDKDFAKFLGLFLADGHCNTAINTHYCMTLAFNVDHEDTIVEMENYLKSINITPSRSKVKGKGVELHFANKFLYALMSECYDDTRDKILPKYAHYLGEDLKYVLEYWLKGDGWLNENINTKPYIGSTISKKLALDMRDIALSVGKYVNIHSCTRKRYNVKTKDQYWVTVIEPENYKSYLVEDVSNYERTFKLAKNGIKKSHFKGKVYNISVEEDESYVCDGIVVHNCVTSLLWGLYFLQTDFFDSAEGVKTIDKDYVVSESEETLPVMIVDDGLEDSVQSMWDEADNDIFDDEDEDIDDDFSVF
jgi:intein/homing endonuclease